MDLGCTSHADLMQLDLLSVSILLKQLVSSLWIRSLGNQLTLANINCSRTCYHEAGAMKKHPHIGLMNIAELL